MKQGTKARIMNKKIFRTLICTLALVLGTTALVAQTQFGEIVGTVTDSSGAVIPGAKVVVTNPSKGTTQTVTTNSHGDYTVPLLPPADGYVITITKGGFAPYTQSQLTLAVADSTKVDVELKPGSEVSVEVNTDATSLDTQQSSLGQVITGDTVADLPLNGRSTFRLIELTPGVTFSDGAQGQFGDVPVNTTWDSTFSVNGGRVSSNEFLIDGIPTATGLWNQITTMPIVDELQEFKVMSSNLSAEYGRYSGGVINVVTKSGTNTIHGDVFEFIRNDALDAYDWFTHQARVTNPSITKDEFRMNQFGGTFGAPVVIPHLYDGHDKTFFFVSYQGTSRIEGEPIFFNVPSVAERTGDFSALAANIFNPFSYTITPTSFTRAGITTKIIPSGMIDPVASYIVNTFYPLPNVPTAVGTANNYFDNLPTRVWQDVMSVRIDQNVTQRWHLYGRYEYSGTNLSYPNHFHNIASGGSSSVGSTHFNNQSFALNNTITLTPNTLLNVSYGFARWYQYKPTLSYGYDTSAFGTTNWGQLHSINPTPAFPNITITGFDALSGQTFINNGNDSHSVLANLTKVIGRQEINVGVDVRMHRINELTQNNPGGTFAFGPQFTRQDNVTTAGGNALASFMLGTAASASFPLASGTEMQDFYMAAYVQDDYRLTAHLTVNAGLRWDRETPFVDRHDHLNYFDPNVSSALANSTFPNLKGGLVFANTNGTGRSVYTRDYLNFGPRVGFAYSPNQDIVFRGGFGISYAPLEVAANSTGFSPNQGYATQTPMRVSVPVGTNASNAGIAPGDLFANPYPNGVEPSLGATYGTTAQEGAAVSVWTQHPPTPYAEQWSLDTQYNLPGRSLLDVAYAGSTGVHLAAPYDRNTLPFSLEEALGNNLGVPVANPFITQFGAFSNPTTTLSQLLLPYPQFTSVQEINNSWAHSSYHSAQVKFAKHDVKNITILVAYTWSKLIANANQSLGGIGPGTRSSTQDFYRLDLEKAVSEQDLPQNFIAHVVYRLPVGYGQHFLNNKGWLDDVVGGWKLNVIWKEQDGVPLVIETSTITGDPLRPDRNMGVPVKIRGKRDNEDIVKQYFNNYTQATTIDPNGNCITTVDPIHPAAFVDPCAYHAGTLRRTVTDLRRPGIQNADLALIKDTQLLGRYRFQFRAEAFNAFNSPHFQGPGQTQHGANFGVITAVRNSPPQREFQFGVKIFF
jgi:hypothetical protein